MIMTVMITKKVFINCKSGWMRISRLIQALYWVSITVRTLIDWMRYVSIT